MVAPAIWYKVCVFCVSTYFLKSSWLNGAVPQGSIIPTGSCPKKEYESANQPAPMMGGRGSWERNFFDDGSNTRAPISASPPTASVPEPVKDTPSGSPTLVSSADAPVPPRALGKVGAPGVCGAPVALIPPSPGALRAPKPTISPVLGTPGTLQGSNPPGTAAWENPPSAPATGILPAPSSCGAEEVGSHSSGTVTWSLPVIAVATPAASACTRRREPTVISPVLVVSLTVARAPVIPQV